MNDVTKTRTGKEISVYGKETKKRKPNGSMREELLQFCSEGDDKVRQKVEQIQWKEELTQNRCTQTILQ